jgi:hypothetical protein
MCAGAAAAAEQRYALGAIQEISKRVKFGIGRPHERGRRQQSGIRRNGAPGRALQRDVAGKNDDGDAALSDRGANGIFQDIRKLIRI